MEETEASRDTVDPKQPNNNPFNPGDTQEAMETPVQTKKPPQEYHNEKQKSARKRQVDYISSLPDLPINQCEEIRPSGEGYVPPVERERRFMINEETKNFENRPEKSKNSEYLDFPALTSESTSAQNETYTGPSVEPSPKDFQNTSMSIWQNLRKGNISYAHRTQDSRPKNVEKTKILKLKILPLFQREHFNNPALIEKEVKEAFNAIMAIFQPKNRQYITISRTNVMKNGKYYQILLVTAPATTEEDVTNAKIREIQIMGKTIFPTGEEYWQYVNSEYPKKTGDTIE